MTALGHRNYDVRSWHHTPYFLLNRRVPIFSTTNLVQKTTINLIAFFEVVQVTYNFTRTVFRPDLNVALEKSLNSCQSASCYEIKSVVKFFKTCQIL